MALTRRHLRQTVPRRRKLESGAVRRVEVALAIFAVLDPTAVTVRHALHGQTFTRVGSAREVRIAQLEATLADREQRLDNIGRCLTQMRRSVDREREVTDRALRRRHWWW